MGWRNLQHSFKMYTGLEKGWSLRIYPCYYKFVIDFKNYYGATVKVTCFYASNAIIMIHFILNYQLTLSYPGFIIMYLFTCSCSSQVGFELELLGPRQTMPTTEHYESTHPSKILIFSTKMNHQQKLHFEPPANQLHWTLV